MLGSVTLQIPLKNYLKKYLLKTFGEEHCATRDSWLGLYLSDILSKDVSGQRTKAISNETYYKVIAFIYCFE